MESITEKLIEKLNKKKPWKNILLAQVTWVSVGFFEHVVKRFGAVFGLIEILRFAFKHVLDFVW